MRGLHAGYLVVHKGCVWRLKRAPVVMLVRRPGHPVRGHLTDRQSSAVVQHAPLYGGRTVCPKCPDKAGPPASHRCISLHPLTIWPYVWLSLTLTLQHKII